jgi:hypothetical protein
MAERTPITEEQLESVRDAAWKKGRMQPCDIVPISDLARGAAADSYHGNPVLKPPTWTWQVPLCFFVGGIAGISSVIALIGHIVGNLGVTRISSWVGLAGGLISAPLLIADLGRPSRFLNMLRVVKLRSPMSLGAWTLSLFSSAAAIAVICRELDVMGFGNTFSGSVEWVAQVVAAVMGLILASYTSVLLCLTAIPVWSENRKVIPAVFLTGALGAAGAVLELLGYLIPGTQFIGILASAAEVVIAIIIEARGRYVDLPLRRGTVGWLLRAGAILAGPIPLVIRIASLYNLELRYVAALSFIAGALRSVVRFSIRESRQNSTPVTLFVL